MTRVVQLKHELVLWNPAHAVHNPNIKEKLKDNMPFPWEYVHLDEILRAFKYPPETLEVPVPHYVSRNRLLNMFGTRSLELTPLYVHSFLRSEPRSTNLGTTAFMKLVKFPSGRRMVTKNA